MFTLNLKIALRNLWKNKVSSFINVIGLAIGLAACLILLIYVTYEWNFDKQSKNSANIYMAMTNISNDNGKVFMTFDGTTTALAPLIKQQIPEVKYVGRMDYGGKGLIANGENSFKKTSRFAEPDILRIYDYQFSYGNPRIALNDPHSVILTEGMAKTLFGTTDVLNRSVRYQDNINLKVTGVIKDLPANSSDQFDYLMPWSFYEELDADAKDLNWGNFSYLTRVLLDADANPELVNAKLGKLLKNYKQLKFATHFLFPQNKIHLYGKFENGRSTGGDIERIWLFMGLAIGILLIACINFMNMATAKSEKRAKEVGIKKTMGASRPSLIIQFLTESMVLTMISIAIAITLAEICLPAFNNLLQMNLKMSYFDTRSWLGIVGLVVITGLVAGSYPAFYLSSFNPIQTLKRKTQGRKMLDVSMRQVLIIGQFCFTIMLIISTLVIYKQIQYIKNRPLGVEVNALVEMPQEGALLTKYDLLKARLLKSGAVTSMYHSYSGLVHHNNNISGIKWPGMTADNNIQFNKVLTTVDFIKTTGLKVIQGRDFSEKYASDTAAVLVSSATVKTMALAHPLGQVIDLFGEKLTIIGVFDDYVFDSPYKSNNPLIVTMNKRNKGAITMRLNPERSLKENTEVIEKISRELNPAYPLELNFVSAAYAALLQQEVTLGILSNLFGGLAIFISCLGLFGLAVYSAEQRTKEFGIRKVLGASVYSLMQLLSLSFLKMIVVAIVIAVPLAYYFMGAWLQKFEFHTTISWWIILIAASGTLLIALLTVGYQAYKTATSNPVDALKYE
ncbi:ABC transporter permease [Pedobacter hartonius]|uniref:ABC-type antimicrobial peptide transport system, permease component n=1 Tax=Pedobacter hartonius TaxID=425514 RepID=A0A1H4GGN9_9SPHI|nr:ABC transporter permease [Pedobacter hartonius]SEB08766.1 ABC-type antimicrobial peptide transport system, permease component [Pedobacter hartonius]